MTQIASLAEFRTYLKKKLGFPVVRICDITDDQLDIAIEEAVEKFQEYATEYGQYEDLMTISTSANVSTYDVDSDITACIENINHSKFSNIGELFTTENILYNAGYFDFEANDILTLQMVMSWVDQIRTLFGTQYDCQIREASHEAVIRPTPKCSGTLGFIVTKKYPEASLYNHIWVKDYAYALTMIQIGMNRSKYEGVQLPGGGTLNGQIFLQEGKDLKEKREEDLKNDFQVPPDFIIG